MSQKTFRHLISLLLTLTLLISACATLAVNISATAEPTKTVAFNNPAIPADVGETVDLSEYGVEFSDTDAATGDVSWTSEDITVSNNKVTPNAKGVYRLTASTDGKTKTVYLTVKDKTDTEYVLFEDSFDTDTLENYSTSGDCSISDGKLVLNSSSGTDAFVLFPSWLGAFGNYSTTSSVNISEANNESRWISMMYRVSGNASSPTPFLQMAVRQNAALSNGVELAHNISGNWGYHTTGSYTSALSSTDYYTLSLDVYNNRAAASINDTLCGTSNDITQVDRGTVGLRSNGSVAYFDSIKVTARFNDDGMPSSPADVRYVESGITLAPNMICEITSKADLDGILMGSPAVAVMTLNANGDVTDSGGNAICPVSEAIKKLGGKVIPAIRLDSSCTVDTATNLINGLRLPEVFFISSDSEQIKAIRKENGLVLGVYDLSKSSEEDMTKIRSSTLSSGAKVCILPAKLATSQNTEYLNSMGVNVWYSSEDNTETEAFKLVTAGANGILCADRALTEKVISSPIFKKNSIIRPVSIIGHRGTPALAPENTIEGSLLAAANGANIIENDIYLTKDGVLVVMHDETIDRTTNGTGKVESFTYAQLNTYKVTAKPTTTEKSYGRIDEKLPIPTLEDYFKAFKNTDTFMFIEIKSKQHQAIAEALKELIGEYDIASQCGVIAFDAAAAEAIRTTIPEISVGYLRNGEPSPATIVADTAKLGTSHNPSMTAVNPELVKYLSARGVFTWPWTIRSKADFDKYFLMGVGGITTDNSYFAKNYVKRVYTQYDSYKIMPNSTTVFALLAETYGSDEDNTKLANAVSSVTKADMEIISGNIKLSYTDGKLISNEEGSATVIFRLPFRLNNGNTAYVYSQPITITVSKDAPVPESPDTPSHTDEAIPPSDSADVTDAPEVKSGCGSCGSSLASPAVAIVAALGLCMTVRRKKKD